MFTASAYKFMVLLGVNVGLLKNSQHVNQHQQPRLQSYFSGRRKCHLRDLKLKKLHQYLKSSCVSVCARVREKGGRGESEVPEVHCRQNLVFPFQGV